MDLAAQFEELMQRSPIPPHDMKTFLREMRRTPSGTIAVSKLLAAKIQSTSEAQAIHAFEFLETALESESEGSIEFRTEIGRYRFLNEIIRILSPKYLGDTTPEPVKERGTKFLQDAAGAKRKRWFPSEHSKVNSVYQSLVDGGIIQKPHRVADEDAEFQKSIFERGENAVILKRLLQSKDPSDLQAANRLIKNLVDEEARRNERRGELHSLIDRIETTTGLLMEILSQPSIDKEIVDELVDTCGSLRQKLGGVATETNDEATSLLQASENIEEVLVLYDSKKDSIGKVSTGSPDQPETSATNSIATANADNKANNPGLSLADELLMNLGDEQIKTVIQQQSSSQHQCKSMRSASGDRLLLNLDVDLAPIKSPTGEEQSASYETVEPFGEIGKISREMMEQGLKGVPDSSQLKKTDKTPLSQLKRSSPSQDQPLPKQTQLPFDGTPGAPQVPAESSLIDSMSLLDLDFLDKPSTSLTETITTTSANNLRVDTTASRLNSSSTNDENLLLDLGSEKPQPVANNRHISNTNGLKNNDESDGPSTNPKQNNSTKSSKTIIPNGMSNNNNSRAPSETGFCLNAVRELDLECIDLLDDLKSMELSLEESCKNVSLTLTFGKYPEFPSAVNVVVITVTNRSRKTGLLNYVFQLLPPKGLQVKLLPPASMELPPWKKAFLPPPILTQVALILVSKSHSSIMTETQPKIKYILSCCVEEETILHNGDFSLPSCLLQQL